MIKTKNISYLTFVIMNENNDGTYTFKSFKNTNYAIDLHQSKSAAGQNTQLYKSKSVKGQKWIFR